MFKSTAFLRLVLCGTAVCLSALGAFAAVHAEEAPFDCRSYILTDGASGRVLKELNSAEALPPASMVKTMVAYTAFKLIQEKRFSLEDVVTVSGEASKIGGSQVYLKEGEEFTVKELLEAVLVQSANDAAFALAEFMAGHPAGFVELMNVNAQELGMKDSSFHSPHGLPPAKGQEPDLISAYDMAVLGRALILEFPESLEYTGLSEAPFRNGTFTMRNHNKLVRTFKGCDGLKTGYYAKAGFCVTASAKRDDVRLITVIMGCPQSRGRDAEAAKLLSTGFALYRNVQIIKGGEPAGGAVLVAGGKLKQVAPVASRDLKVLLSSAEEKRIEKEVKLCPGVNAPVQKGKPCGALFVHLDGQVVGKVSLIVGENIAKAGLLDQVKGFIGW